MALTVPALRDAFSEWILSVDREAFAAELTDLARQIAPQGLRSVGPFTLESRSSTGTWDSARLAADLWRFPSLVVYVLRRMRYESVSYGEESVTVDRLRSFAAQIFEWAREASHRKGRIARARFNEWRSRGWVNPDAVAPHYFRSRTVRRLSLPSLISALLDPRQAEEFCAYYPDVASPQPHFLLRLPALLPLPDDHLLVGQLRRVSVHSTKPSEHLRIAGGRS